MGGAAVLDEDERMQLARKLLLTTEWIVEAGQKHGQVSKGELVRDRAGGRKGTGGYVSACLGEQMYIVLG